MSMEQFTGIKNFLDVLNNLKCGTSGGEPHIFLIYSKALPVQYFQRNLYVSAE